MDMHFGRKRIGIIGAGIAGLHLGLRLRQLNIHCTIMTDCSAEQVAGAQLGNTVVHWPATLGRERVLGVYHWPAEEFGFHEFRHVIQTQKPFEIRNRAVMRWSAILYGVRQARLMTLNNSWVFLRDVLVLYQSLLYFASRPPIDPNLTTLPNFVEMICQRRSKVR